MMKTLITAALAVCMIGLAPRAEAQIRIGWSQTYVSGRAACGCPIQTKRTCRGHDRYHRPIFAYERQDFRCGCNKHRGQSDTLRKYYDRLEEDYRELEKAERKYRERLRRGDYRDREKAYRKYQEERRKREQEARKHRQKIDDYYRKHGRGHHRY
jgi:hypothetical protein